jgi:hypothetical protein
LPGKGFGTPVRLALNRHETAREITRRVRQLQEIFDEPSQESSRSDLKNSLWGIEDGRWGEVDVRVSAAA